MSEQAKIATHQELIKEARSAERVYDVIFYIGVFMAAIGFFGYYYPDTLLSGDLIAFFIGAVGIPVVVLGIVGSRSYGGRKKGLILELRNLDSRILTCPKCGNQIPRGSDGFCPFCGYLLTPQPP